MKTGLHLNDVRDGAQVIDYYRRTGAKVVKTMAFPRDVLQELKAMGVFIVGRKFFEDQPLDGAGMGRAVREILALRWQVPEVDAWEFYNEEAPSGDAMSKYGEGTRDFIREMRAAGRVPVAGCFATGNPPDFTDWPRWRTVLEELYTAGGLLGLHEYGWYMQWLAGGNQWDWATGRPVRLDDPVTDSRAEGYLCLRYRKVWQHYLQPWGLGRLPIFIGEGGSDDTPPRPGPQGGGYKAAADWCRENGLPDYAHQRRWYMEQVSHDDGNGRPLVFGVVDFGFQDTSVDDDGRPKWRNFDMSTDPVTLNSVIRLEGDLPIGHFGGTTMTDLDKLAAEAATHQLIQLNPTGALGKAAKQRGAAGPAATSGEWISAAGAYAGHQAQRFEWPDGHVEVATWNPATGLVSWHPFH